jgi:hypothetical protein
MLPCVYAFMNGKSEEDYKRVIGYVKQAATKLGIRLNPKTIMTDFELAAINAFKYEFPGATNKGCFFHFNQCLYRKVCEVGLKTDYSESDTVNLLVRLSMILPLVPLNEISEAYYIVTEYKPEVFCPKIEKFMDYVFTQWVGDVSMEINNVYEHELWNHHGSKVRTNNHIEGFHSKLNKLVKAAKPHIFKMVNVIKRQEDLTSVKYIQLQKRTRPQSNTEQLKNVKIQALKDKYELDEDYDLVDYMLDLSKFCKNFDRKKTKEST